jgi:hypothetical protein
MASGDRSRSRNVNNSTSTKSTISLEISSIRLGVDGFKKLNNRLMRYNIVSRKLLSRNPKTIDLRVIRKLPLQKYQLGTGPPKSSPICETIAERGSRLTASSEETLGPKPITCPQYIEVEIECLSSKGGRISRVRTRDKAVATTLN